MAACLIGDPELLILDEPMNGLDPAGMHEMRDMILSLVAEGRTVVLSSHLLDEVERTCDAVAIVDRGNVIRQGSIAELLAGAAVGLQIDCSDPERASGSWQPRRSERRSRCCPRARRRASRRDRTRRDRRDRSSLVEGGIAVYRLQEIQASLESWFLQVTSRLGSEE